MPFARPVNPNPIQGELAIIVPTYRFNDRAKLLIQNVMSLASERIAVLIADNSENPEKWNFLEHCANGHPNIHVFCHSKNIGAFENWAFLLGQGQTPYCCQVGDDDFVMPDYFPKSIDLLNQHPEAVAASGLFVLHYSQDEPPLVLNLGGPRIEPDGLGRLQGYVQHSHGNVLSCAVVRRSAFAKHVAYLGEHPFVASFFDWVMAYGLLAQGHYLRHNEGGYWYDAGNWSNPQAVVDNDTKFYVERGLDVSFVNFHKLHWAVEVVHYFLGRYAPPIPLQERLQIANMMCRNYAAFFASQQWQPHRAAFEALLINSPQAIAAVDAILATTDITQPQFFEHFATLIAAFSPELSQRYLSFVQQSLRDGALTGHP